MVVFLPLIRACRERNAWGRFVRRDHDGLPLDDGGGGRINTVAARPRYTTLQARCNEYMNSYKFLQIHENPNFNESLQIHEIPARLKQAPVFEYFPSNRFFRSSHLGTRN